MLLLLLVVRANERAKCQQLAAKLSPNAWRRAGL